MNLGTYVMFFSFVFATFMYSLWLIFNKKNALMVQRVSLVTLLLIPNQHQGGLVPSNLGLLL
jgi:hypothetical protein